MINLTHMDKFGSVNMVDVTEKRKTIRKAIATSTVFMSKKVFQIIINNKVKKGNVFEISKIAGIMAAKNTSNLIPLCHSLNLSNIKIIFFKNDNRNSIRIESNVTSIDATGVEMEALVAVSVASLTIYDMCKSYDRSLIISDMCLLKKSGGESGKYIR